MSQPQHPKTNILGCAEEHFLGLKILAACREDSSITNEQQRGATTRQCSRRTGVIHAAERTAAQPPPMPCARSVVDTNGAGVPAAVYCRAPCT